MIEYDPNVDYEELLKAQRDSPLTKEQKERLSRLERTWSAVLPMQKSTAPTPD